MIAAVRTKREPMTTEATSAPTMSDASGQRGGLRSDGGVEVGRFTLPYSDLASDAAREAFIKVINPPPPEVGGDVLALRAHYAKQNQRLADRMLEMFDVVVREDRIGGVRVHRVSPAQVWPENSGRVLVCLHGGAFAWGADSGALVEAIPIADRMGMEVIAVDYRLAPEHRFPAASEDVAAVYRELIGRHAPEAIGIYGCSAGGVLTAQALAWFAKTKLPRPGAVAILGAGGGDMRGDAPHLTPALEGYGQPAGEPPRLAGLDYFAGASLEDPCVFPGDHPAVLSRFPPTLVIAGGRDFAASSATNLHLKLDEAGVETRLFVFDGLWHAFHVYPELPESQQVYRILARFFDHHLAA